MSKQTLSQWQYEIGARMGRGDLAGASRAAEDCRSDWPQDAAGWVLGSIVALLADDKESALALVEQRLATDAGNVQCLLQKAECWLALGNRDQALAAADAAAANANGLVMSLDAVGEFLFHMNEHRRAVDVYDRAIAAAPRDPAVRAKRADLHRVLGNLDLALADYETVLALSPKAPRALKGIVELRRQSHERNLVTALEAALASTPQDGVEAAILHFGLAKSHEDMGDHAASWHHLDAANRIERSRISYSPDQDRAFIERIVAGFPHVEAAAPDTTGERPIFIVGIPRTGSTLIERIIGSHSQVHSAGEIPALPEAIDVAVERTLNDGSRPSGALSEANLLGRLDGKDIAAQYLLRAYSRRGALPRVTDKLLTNFFHCALIFRAFPKARIVHVTRHPLAAIYAIYRTRFTGTYPFAYDLREIAEFYVGYRRLMAHWHRVLPGRILDVRYEDVVTALEPTTRRLLDYVGLPFEAGCLEFQRNPDPVMTTSSVQVRQPLYDSSLHLWRHHARELDAVKARLTAAGIGIDPP